MKEELFSLLLMQAFLRADTITHVTKFGPSIPVQTYSLALARIASDFATLNVDITLGSVRSLVPLQKNLPFIL